MRECMKCGKIIPDNRHVCLSCEGQNEMQTFETNHDKEIYIMGYKDGLESVMKEECESSIIEICKGVTSAIKDVIPLMMDRFEFRGNPVKHGLWSDNGEDKYICSVCHGYVYRWFGKSDFCPRCGARMGD